MTGPDIEALLADPDWHLFAFDGADAVFRRMDRLAYYRSIFLDDRIVASPGEWRVPLAELLDRVDAIPLRRTGWIFHLSHCGSTLLARALDRPGTNLVLREPQPFRQLAFEGVTDARLRLAVRLAGRGYQPETPTIVKANVPVNFILPAIARLDPGAPAIFLHLAFEPYLLAMLRTPRHRDRLMRLTDRLADRIGDLSGLGASERAAALWLAQINAFDEAMILLPNSRSLDAETLYSSPRPVLAAAADLFGLALKAADLDAIVDGKLFATHAKDPARSFDNARRITLAQEAAITLAPEISRARAWLADKPVPPKLARPLTGAVTRLP